jgi:hypothetical protein
MTTPVCHFAMKSRSSGGKSEPQSTIQPTDFDLGGGENRRAPRAEYAPAPPTMSLTGGFGGGNSISSDRDEHRRGQRRCIINAPIMNMPKVQKSI